MQSTIQFWMASIYIQNWMTLTIQIQMKVTVVNIIQNWMTLIIQIAGLVKDLGLLWSSPKPCWWPSEFPYCHPKHAPMTTRVFLLQHTLHSF